jgi:hypothetical protein
LGFAFQRSLLNVAAGLIAMEHSLFAGQRSYGSQHLGVSFGRVYENRQLYNTPQNRSNVRDTRLFGDPKAFVLMVSNALRRCNERHELWLNFIINCVPYLDRFVYISFYSFVLFWDINWQKTLEHWHRLLLMLLISCAATFMPVCLQTLLVSMDYHPTTINTT